MNLLKELAMYIAEKIGITEQINQLTKPLYENAAQQVDCNLVPQILRQQQTTIIADALFAQDISHRKDKLDAESISAQRDKSQALAETIPQEIRKLIATRYLIQYEKRCLVAQKKSYEKLIVKGQIERLSPGQVFRGFGFGFDRGFYLL